MTSRLLAFLFDELTPPERREIEHRLQTDPQWREELQRLQACLCPEEPTSPQAGQSQDATNDHRDDPDRDAPDRDDPDRDDPDRDDPDALLGSGAPASSGKATHEMLTRTALPQADLVQRTCCLVQKFDQRQKARRQCEVAAAGCGAGRWSLADVAIAGGILFCLASLILPAMRQQRDQARRIACQDNLRFLGTALADYFDRHQRLPHIQLGQNAGLYTAALAAEGGIGEETLARRVLCPSSQLAQDVAADRVRVRIMALPQLASIQGAPLAEAVQTMGGSYAYRIGYRDAAGNYRHMRWQDMPSQPLLADSPSAQTPGFRSANHGGCGQNVLWADVSVKFMSDCLLSDDRSPCGRRDQTDLPRPSSVDDFTDNVLDNLFVNRHGQPAAGWGSQDIVLLPSDYGPTGRIVPIGRFAPFEPIVPVGRVAPAGR